MAKETIRQIDKEFYQATYDLIKSKYTPKIIDTWNESTDAQKYIFEDVAIASYIKLLLDKQHNFYLKPGMKRHKILDAGCGNALVGYFLSKMGIDYLGVDLQKRKIWEQLDKLHAEDVEQRKSKRRKVEESEKLYENLGISSFPIKNEKREIGLEVSNYGEFETRQAAIVSKNFVETYERENVSIILGNHSDELTPWMGNWRRF